MVDHPDGICQSRERLMWLSWIIPQVTLPQYFFLLNSPCFLQLQSTGCGGFNPDNCVFNPLFQGVQTLRQQANIVFSSFELLGLTNSTLFNLAQCKCAMLSQSQPRKLRCQKETCVLYSGLLFIRKLLQMNYTESFCLSWKIRSQQSLYPKKLTILLPIFRHKESSVQTLLAKIKEEARAWRLAGAKCLRDLCPVE